MDEKRIVQLIPCTTPIFNVYKNDDGSYFHERVCCLALCADDIIRSISCCEYFEFAEESRNYVGCFTDDCLTNYPTSIS